MTFCSASGRARCARAGEQWQKIEKQHKAGKLTARERIEKLLDHGTRFVEIGLLIAYDKYESQAPAAGVVTGIGHVEGYRPAVIVANDATVKGRRVVARNNHQDLYGALRKSPCAIGCRSCIWSTPPGVNLPYQDGIFPGQYGAGRIFYYNSLMRRKMHVPADRGG